MKPRQYQLSKLVQDIINQNRDIYPRLKEMVHGICAKLASNENLGKGRRKPTPDIPGQGKGLYSPVKWVDLPAITVKYRYNDEKLVVTELIIKDSNKSD